MRQPFLPDIYLGRAYLELARAEKDQETKRGLLERAIKAIDQARKTGQVTGDPESAEAANIETSARGDLAALPPPGGEKPPVIAGGSDSPPVVPSLDAERKQIQSLFAAGDQALATRDWEAATRNFNSANDLLVKFPDLRKEFPEAPGRRAEASLASEIAGGVESLRNGAFDRATESLRSAEQKARGMTFSSTTVRALAGELAGRVSEAQLGELLINAEALEKSGRFADALSEYQAAATSAAALNVNTFISPRSMSLVGSLPKRIAQVQSALLQAQVAQLIKEQKYGLALELDPTNQTALQGQYELASTAYNQRNWSDAYIGFTILNKANPKYRDVAERSIASNAQQELAAGIKAQNEKAASDLARQHYSQVLALNKSLTTLRDTPPVVQANEDAVSRLNQLDSADAFMRAETSYRALDFESARTDAQLAERLDPKNTRATALLAKLADDQSQRNLTELGKQAQILFESGDLAGARRAAQDLDQALPGTPIAAQILAQIETSESARTQRIFWIGSGTVVAAIGPLLFVNPRRRGRFMDFIGRPASALKLYERVLTRNPADGETLSRAVALVTAHGLSASLDARFDAYLKARPGDPDVVAAAADHFWLSGNRRRAVDIYEEGLASRVQRLPAAAFDRMAEVHEKGLPSRTLPLVEAAGTVDESNTGVTRLLAREYARADRSDATALAVFRAASLQDPSDASLGLRYARALLAQGQLDAAANETERVALVETDRLEPLDLLAEIYLRAHAARPTDAVNDLARRRLPITATLVVGEQLAVKAPALRGALADLYAKQGATVDEQGAGSLLSAHRLLDAGHVDDARGEIDKAVAARGSSTRLLRALIQAHARCISVATASGAAVDPELHVRIAQMNEEGGWSFEAIAAWQQTVSIPEWNRRSMTAIENILDRLSLDDLAHLYFATAGWRVSAAVSDDLGTFVERRVAPNQTATAEIAGLVGDTQVFCYPGVVTVDDVVKMKRGVLERKSEDATAFLIAGQAVRHDVYALVYAFMTEDPAVTLIPLEAQTIREAIVGARSRTHLERTLHQWLGHTDVFEAHNPVSNAATFFGRGHFINQLVLKISRGENFGIFGLRKIGKTSLVYRLRELSRDHLVAYVDLQGVTSRGVSEVYRRLIESLVRDLRVKHPSVAMTLPDLRSNDEDATDVSAIAADFHRDLLKIRKAFEQEEKPLPHILLLLDEIELMIPARVSRGSSVAETSESSGSSESAGSPGFEGHQDFFRHLRGLYQQERFVVSAVVGASPAICRTASWNGRDNPVFQFYDEVFLAPLDRSECDQMVQGLGEVMGVRFDTASLRLIYEETAGHPYVARQLCSRLVTAFPERPLEAHESMVHSALEAYLAQRGDYFSGIVTGYLSPEARSIVETIAALDEQGAERADILRTVEHSPHVADRELGDMELSGLVRRDGTRYSLRMPVFRRWLRRSWLGLE
ncbi:MAG TPA: hypothetical protein VM846_20130 [Vicinamibacterales bacterium]|nr:hypothetical protein [Vicinamibacterales bacterium]